MAITREQAIYDIAVFMVRINMILFDQVKNQEKALEEISGLTARVNDLLQILKPIGDK